MEYSCSTLGWKLPGSDDLPGFKLFKSFFGYHVMKFQEYASIIGLAIMCIFSWSYSVVKTEKNYWFRTSAFSLSSYISVPSGFSSGLIGRVFLAWSLTYFLNSFGFLLTSMAICFSKFLLSLLFLLLGSGPLLTVSIEIFSSPVCLYICHSRMCALLVLMHFVSTISAFAIV